MPSHPTSCKIEANTVRRLRRQSTSTQMSQNASKSYKTPCNSFASPLAPWLAERTAVADTVSPFREHRGLWRLACDLQDQYQDSPMGEAWR